MKRYYPAFFLIAAPYIFLLIAILAIVLDDGLSNSALNITVISYLVMVAFIFLPNIIFAIYLLVKKGESTRILFWDMVLKLSHIPFFIVILTVGIILSLLLTFTISLLLLLVAVDYLLLLATSSYGIIGIVRARKEKQISLASAIVHIVLHLIFVTDVISALIVYLQSRAAKRKKASAARSTTPRTNYRTAHRTSKAKPKPKPRR